MRLCPEGERRLAPSSKMAGSNSNSPRQMVQSRCSSVAVRGNANAGMESACHLKISGMDKQGCDLDDRAVLLLSQYGTLFLPMPTSPRNFPPHPYSPIPLDGII